MILLAIGSVIATASQLLLILPFVYKEGYKYKPIFDIKDKHIKNMVYIALPEERLFGLKPNRLGGQSLSTVE